MTYISQLHLAKDTPFHLERFTELMLAIENGNYPWYINYNGLNGFGYFLKAFYCDITLIPFALIALISNIYIGYKALIFTTMFLSATFMYIVMRKITSNHIMALIAAILFGFSAYFRYRLLINASISEPLAFAFVPIVFWGFYEIIIGNVKRWAILSIGYTLVLFTHMLSTLLITVFLSLIGLLYIKKIIKEPKRLLYLLYASVATILLSAIFLFPFLEQYFANTYYFQTSGVILPQLQGIYTFSKLIEFMYRGTTALDTIPEFSIGVIITFSLAMRLYIKGNSKIIRLADILTGIGIFFILMTLKGVPWNFPPFIFLNSLQFTWRIYSLSVLCFSIGSSIYIGTVIDNLNLSYHRSYVIVGFIIITSLFIIKSESDQYTEYKKDFEKLDYRYNAKTFRYVGSEYVPSNLNDLNYIFQESNSFPKVLNADTEINNYIKNRGDISFSITNTNKDFIELPLLYYKGYRFEKQNGAYLPISQSNNGLVQIEISPNATSQKIKGSYKGTLIQTISTIVSTLSFLILIGWTVYKRR
ncbi:6-pyruvoyl-tetrahydropterin synthase-related protein [Dysgonomonas sp. ZJ279]|uniref:6-pyruvoyl-tetrahydropterin synthase-related protein n=1 Tax=Dysgonomonas sp. ZJ279 TaxID=2709796 RepID=UPI0013EE18E1|nr:6-pyruvoyl-tetrahydropterin synthase-related protein [Dysgonomonas sp. ZJ279]